MDILQPKGFLFFQPGYFFTSRCAHGRPTVYPLASLAQLENRGLGLKKCTSMGWFITAVGVHVVFFLNVIYSEIEYPVLWKDGIHFLYVVEKIVWMIGSSLLNYFL